MMRQMPAKIYLIPGSHPCAAAVRAAELKNIDYKTIVVLPPLHRLQMKLGFGGGTVPAMKIDGEKIQTTKAIMRALESIHPEPPLFPSDPDERERVLAAEDWADGNFQDIGRRLVWLHLIHTPQDMKSFIGPNDRVPLPGFLQDLFAKPVAEIQRRLNRGTEAQVEEDLKLLPSLLDRVDQYVADGVIGGKQPNAADLQIGASLSLWMSMDDLRPFVEGRPGGKLARKLFPNFIGHVSGGSLPSAWFDPLRRSQQSRAAA